MNPLHDSARFARWSLASACLAFACLTAGFAAPAAGLETEAAPASAPAPGPAATAPTPSPRGAIRLTPAAGAEPRIHGARIFGARPGAPVHLAVPASGNRPMQFAATGLPAGLAIDPATGGIAGVCAQPGEYAVALVVSNKLGRDEQPLRLIVGDAVGLTPPMTWTPPAGGRAAVAGGPAEPRSAAETLAASPLSEHGWSLAADADGSGGAPAVPPAAGSGDPAGDSWRNMATIGFIRSRSQASVGPGRWNELAPLFVGWIGPADAPHPTRLTPDEQSTQVSLWCLLCAPLRLNCDLARLDPFTLGLLTNDEVLALDQDPLGRAASRIAQEDTVQTWAKPLADGSIAVGFFNVGPDPAAASLVWADLNLSGPQIVRDLWRQRDLGAYAERFDAPMAPHGVFLFRVRPAPPDSPAR